MSHWRNLNLWHSTSVCTVHINLLKSLLDNEWNALVLPALAGVAHETIAKVYEQYCWSQTEIHLRVFWTWYMDTVKHPDFTNWTHDRQITHVLTKLVPQIPHTVNNYKCKMYVTPPTQTCMHAYRAHTVSRVVKRLASKTWVNSNVDHFLSKIC